MNGWARAGVGVVGMMAASPAAFAAPSVARTGDAVAAMLAWDVIVDDPDADTSAIERAYEREELAIDRWYEANDLGQPVAVWFADLGLRSAEQAYTGAVFRAAQRGSFATRVEVAASRRDCRLGALGLPPRLREALWTQSTVDITSSELVDLLAEEPNLAAALTPEAHALLGRLATLDYLDLDGRAELDAALRAPNPSARTRLAFSAWYGDEGPEALAQARLALTDAPDDAARLSAYDGIRLNSESPDDEAIGATTAELELLRRLLAAHPHDPLLATKLREALVYRADWYVYLKQPRMALRDYGEYVPLGLAALAANAAEPAGGDRLWTYRDLEERDRLVGALDALAGAQDEVGDGIAASTAREQLLGVTRPLVAAGKLPSSLRPPHVDALRQLGFAASRAGNYAEQDRLLSEGITLLRSGPDAQADEQLLQLFLIDQGQTRVNLGDAPAAVLVLTEALTIGERRVAARPGDTNELRNLSLTLSRIGDSHKLQKDHPAAVASYTAGIAVAGPLHEQHPADFDFLVDLTVLLDKRSGQLKLLGDLPGAFRDSTEAVELGREALGLKRTPTALRNQSIYTVNQAAALQATGRLADALPLREEGVKLRRELLESFPNDRTRVRDLASDVADLGLLQRDLAHNVDAEKTLSEAATLFGQLLAVTPDHRDDLQFAAVVVSAQGRLARARNDHAGALALAERALAMDERLVAMVPEDRALKGNKAAVLSQVSELRLLLHDESGALAAAEACVAIARELVATGSEPRFQRDLAVELSILASAQRAVGPLDSAMAATLESLTLHQALARASPRDPRNASDVIAGYDGLCVLQRDTGKLAEAQATCAEGVRFGRARLVAAPDDYSAAIQYWGVAADLAYMQKDAGDSAAAIAAFREVVASARRFLAADPARDSARRQITGSTYGLATALTKAGRNDEALAALAEAKTLLEADLVAWSGDQRASRDLSLCDLQVARILVVQKRVPEAILAANAALTRSRALLAADPLDANVADDVGRALWNLAGLEGSGVTWADVVREYEALERSGVFVAASQTIYADALSRVRDAKPTLKR